jgi:hypothetical protein
MQTTTVTRAYHATGESYHRVFSNPLKKGGKRIKLWGVSDTFVARQILRQLGATQVEVDRGGPGRPKSVTGYFGTQHVAHRAKPKPKVATVLSRPVYLSLDEVKACPCCGRPY